MQDYLHALRCRYHQLLRLSSRTASTLFARNTPVCDSDILRYIRNVEIGSSPRPRICSVLRDGTRSTVLADIVTIFKLFFESFFTSYSTIVADSISASTLLRGLPQVPEELFSTLCCPATASELEAVVSNMKTGSTPGPDGLPAEFYKTFWPVLSGSLVLLVNEFFMSGHVPLSFKLGRITLLPKGSSSDPSDPRSYRPITLLNTDSKS